MSQSIVILTLPILATAALTADRFVSLTGGVPAAGGNSPGVAQSGAAIGEMVPVACIGTAVVEFGGAVAVNGLVECDNQGRAIAKDAGATLGRLAPGQAAVTVAGEKREVILFLN